ncbi:MAG: hypothetical protein WC626_08865 [Methanoregula sp.]
MKISSKKEPRTPLARLVLFMVCLSIAGTFVAGTHYVMIDRPAQEYAAHPPTNLHMDLTNCNNVGSDWFAGVLALFTFGQCVAGQVDGVGYLCCTG